MDSSRSAGHLCCTCWLTAAPAMPTYVVTTHLMTGAAPEPTSSIKLSPSLGPNISTPPQHQCQPQPKQHHQSLTPA